MTDTISAAPFVQIVVPYINIIVPPIVGAVLTWAAWKVQQLTGVKIQEASLAQLKSAAATQAGALIAKSENNLSGKIFTTNSPEVVAAAAAVAAALPQTAAAVGATPQALQTFVVGEIGKLQAGQSAPAQK